MEVTAETRYEDLPTFLTPAEFFRWAKIKRSKGYSLLSDGSINSVSFGRLIRIPREDLMEFIRDGGTRE